MDIRRIADARRVTQTGAAAEPEGDVEACECSSGEVKQRLHFPPEVERLWRRVVGVELQSHTVERESSVSNHLFCFCFIIVSKWETFWPLVYSYFIISFIIQSFVQLFLSFHLYFSDIIWVIKITHSFFSFTSSFMSPFHNKSPLLHLTCRKLRASR